MTTENQVEILELGTTIIASTISYLDNSIFYLGSKVNDAKCILIKDQCKEGSFVWIIFRLKEF